MESISEYWQQTYIIGQMPVGKGQFERTLCIKWHEAREETDDKSDIQLGLELPAGTNERIYIHAKPCIVEPVIVMGIALEGDTGGTLGPPHTVPSPGGFIGRTVDSEIHGYDKRPIGTSQAWYYPSIDTLVIWESFINKDSKRFYFGVEPDKSCDPLADGISVKVWKEMESLLLKRFPQARHIVTPAWDSAYSKDVWQSYLRELGYQPLSDNEDAFIKIR
jgi:hypothetical protein